MYIYLFIGLLIYYFNNDKCSLMVTCSDLQYVNSTPPMAVMEELLHQNNITNESMDEGFPLLFEPIISPINVNSVNSSSEKISLDKENQASSQPLTKDKLNLTKQKLSTNVNESTIIDSRNKTTDQTKDSQPKFLDTTNLSSRIALTKNETFDKFDNDKIHRNVVPMSQYSTSIYSTSSQSLHSSIPENHSTSYADIIVPTSVLTTSKEVGTSSNIATSSISSNTIALSKSRVYPDPISTISISSISSVSENKSESNIEQDQSLLLPSKLINTTVDVRETLRKQETDKVLQSEIYPSLSQSTDQHLWFTHTLDELSTFQLVPTKSFSEHSQFINGSATMLNSKPDTKTMHKENSLQLFTATPHSTITVSSTVKFEKDMFSLYDRGSNLSVWGEVITSPKDESTTIRNQKRQKEIKTQKEVTDFNRIQNREREDEITTKKEVTDSTEIRNRKTQEHIRAKKEIIDSTTTVQSTEKVKDSTTIRKFKRGEVTQRDDRDVTDSATFKKNQKRGEVMTTQHGGTDFTTEMNWRRGNGITKQSDYTESTTVQNRKTVQHLSDRPMRIIPVVQPISPSRNGMDTILSKITDISSNGRVTTTGMSTKQGDMEEEEDVLSEDTVIIIIIGSVIGSVALVAAIVILTTCLQKRKKTQTNAVKSKDVEMNKKDIPLTKIETQSETISERNGITEDPTSDGASETKVDET